MRVRFYVVAAGLIVGVALKIGLAGLSASGARPFSETRYGEATATDAVAENSAHSDPLVPPASVSGLAPMFPDQRARPGINISAILDVFAHDPRASFHAHGEKVCASGCAASNHPTEELSEEHYAELLNQFAVEPADETSLAFETLLFYGRQTKALIHQRGFGPLDADRAKQLWSELQRGRARISIRVLDEFGEVRSHLPSTEVPLDRRHVFDMETNKLQPLVTSGTVKRVGLDHLWTRL